jgi:acyl-CoA synthetase (AMP-forming)/AMP-acid ligase II
VPIETIAALLAARTEDAANSVAIVSDAERITYAELDRRSALITAEFIRRGVDKTHRVGLLMANGLDWALVAYALMRIGAVLVPLSTLLRPRELQQQLATAGVRRLIVGDSHHGRDYRADLAQLDRDALPSLNEVWWWSELKPQVPETADLSMVRAFEARLRPADDMVVMFTSGSRGTPKGVIHTHGGALRATAAGLVARCIDRSTRLYLPMPFFWMGGFGTGLIASLIAGATLLTEAQPEPGRTLRFLAQEKATLFRGWPEQALQLAAHPDFAATDLSALKPGSLDAVLPPPLRSAPGARANLFGMTESFGPYSAWPLDQDLPKDGWGSCGKPFEGMNVRIVDPANGAVLPAGEVGSIQLSGHNILRGICEREREEVFTRDLWYDTGDLGRLDADGFLFFAGRSDDMFKVKGATVYPSEVEDALAAVPGVGRAFAAEITVDGATAVGAAVLPDAGAALDLRTLAEAARQRLSAFKLPVRWVILASVDDLPKTDTGKIDKPRLRALLEAGAPAPARAASPTPG